jgi:hypothetical protein
MSSLATRLCLTIVLTFVLSSAASAGLIFDVNVMVQGYTGPQKIGSIEVNTGAPDKPDEIYADFTFSDAFNESILDGWYNFRWVQVVTEESTPVPPLFTIPSIDPLPKQYMGGIAENAKFADNLPYYDPETRKEGISSSFLDQPIRPAGSILKFDTFLVAEDITAGDFAGQQFSVLAGFNWTYTAGDPAKSTTGVQIAIEAATIAGINTALGNDDTFKTWTALKPQSLKPCPEPTSLTVFGLGALGLVGWRLRRSKETRLHLAA